MTPTLILIGLVFLLVIRGAFILGGYYEDGRGATGDVYDRIRLGRQKKLVFDAANAAAVPETPPSAPPAAPPAPTRPPTPAKPNSGSL